MPALTIPTLAEEGSSGDPPARTADDPSQTASEPGESQEDSLDRPPESPLTPTRSHIELPEVPRRQHSAFPPPRTTFIDHPEPVPISESTNPDAAALRSAISLLQMQRNRSKEHIQTLERIKNEALADPQAFKEELLAGRMKATTASGILGPTLGEVSTSNDDDDDDDDDDNDDDKTRDGHRSARKTAPKSRYGPIPAPQNIIKTPSINWDKYHIVGAPLDKLHEEQKQRNRVIAEPYKVGFADGANTQRYDPKKSI